MVKKTDLLTYVQSLPYFSRADLEALPFSPKNIEQIIYRGSRSGEILRLKRGIYTSRTYVQSVQMAGNLTSFQEFIANVLVQPSYITAEYILSKNELLTEAVTTITSYTPLRPILISNPLGNFRYRNITNSTIGEFEMITVGGFSIKRASKLQALIDYLYLKKKQLREISKESVEGLRINLHLLSPSEFRQLHHLAKPIKSKKLNLLISVMESIYASS